MWLTDAMVSMTTDTIVSMNTVVDVSVMQANLVYDNWSNSDSNYDRNRHHDIYLLNIGLLVT